MRHPLIGVIVVTCCIVTAVTTMIYYIRHGQMNTVSQFLADMGCDPLFMFATGGLLMHWFGGVMRPVLISKKDKNDGSL